MCSHLPLTRDDLKFLRSKRIKSWSECGFCEKPEPKAPRPIKRTRLHTEESVNREEEDGDGA